jgi:ATP-dependent DNA helicase RecG
VSETDQPTLGVATWANFASIRRTIEWVGLDSSRIEKSMYTGATVLRLLEKIAATEGLDSEVQEKVAALTKILSAFDGADAAARTDIIAQARVILDSLIPLGELGARRHDLVPKSRLSKPSRRDRRPRREKEKPEAADDAAEAAVSSADPEAAGKDADSVEVEEASEADGSTQVENVENVEPEVPDLYAWLNLPKTSPSRAGRRAPRRLEWNHPEGTGRPLSALGVLDENALGVLANLGIETISDFLLRPPVGHTRAKLAQFSPPGGEDDVDVAEADLGSPEDQVMVRGRVVSRLVRITVNGARHELTLNVRKAGMVRCAWADGSPRGWDNWGPDMELAFIGAPEEGDDGWNLFQAEPVGVDGRGSGLMPVYGIDGVDEAVLRAVGGRAIGGIMGQLREPLPRRLVEYHKLIGRDEALRDAHFPSNQAGKGRNRLAFEELLLLQAGIGWRAKSRNPDRGLSHKVLHATVGELGIQQHIRLSDSQEVVFSEIRRDLKSSHAMVRLLQGEVGTNKTTIALLASAIVMQNKAQVLYVLPDASSAERRFLFSEGIFRSVGIAPALIPDKPNRGQLDAISRGECQIVFGTRSLLENAPKWNKLGLVVVEERNEYGTVDPATLVASGPAPDLLVITDTPIPTSLTLTVFGEYRMSMLPSDEETDSCATVFNQADRLDAYALVREAIEEGRQAYVVFPVGEDGDLLGPDDALRYAGALQSDALEGARIGVYCSAMSREDRLRMFEDFQHRRLDVLVATTHIEEAPVVPNATVVVIEHADHHELARLHRLRGYVGQGLEPGQCLMVMAEDPSDDAKERLTRLSEERDGFKVAEMDLKERGWDALLGEGAEAPPVFHWADPVLDHQQLLRARDEAFHMVKLDPGMRRSREMVDAVVERWGEWLGHDFSAAKADSQSGTGRAKDQRKGRRRRRRRR